MQPASSVDHGLNTAEAMAALHNIKGEAQQYCLETEQAVLGCILYDNTALEICEAHDLQPEDFYDSYLATIYAECRLLAAHGVASPLTLRPRVENTDGFKDTGGHQFLAGIYAAAVGVSAVSDFVQRLRHLSAKRRILAAFCETALVMSEPDTDPAEMVALAEERIVRAARSEGPGDRRSLDEQVTLAVNEAMSRCRGEPVPGFITGLQAFDKLKGSFRPGHLNIIAARPSMGKTVVGVEFGLRCAMQGEHALIFSLEMSATELVERMASSIASDEIKVPYRNIGDGTLNASQQRALQQAGERLKGLPLTIEDTAGQSASRIAAKALRMKRKLEAEGQKLGCVVVDYLGLMAAEDRRASEVKQEGDKARALKDLAKGLGCPVIALSQINRGVESRDDKRPRMSDLRQSGNIEEHADSVILLYREEYYHRRDPRSDPAHGEHAIWQHEADDVRNVLEIIVDKNRGGAVGAVGLFCDVTTNTLGPLRR